MGSHATGCGSGQPTPAQLKELFAQIESGRVTKSRMQEFLRGSTQTVSLGVAKGIVGKKSFFGPEDWTKFFGNEFQTASTPEIPWSQAELENPEINQEHFLFLGLERLPNGRPLNLIAWHSLCPGTYHPRFTRDWYLGNKFAQKACGLRWYLMPVGIFEGSENLSFTSQVLMLPDDYEVPTVSARVTANILYYELNKKYLDISYWARTRDKFDGGRRVVVRALTDLDRPFADQGLSFNHMSDDDDCVEHYIGVSASRKL